MHPLRLGGSAIQMSAYRFNQPSGLGVQKLLWVGAWPWLTWVSTLFLILAIPAAKAQLDNAQVGVAVKIYARGYGPGGYVTAYGTFLPSSPSSNDAYASATGYANASPYYATAVLGANGFVRIEPGKSYTVSVSSSGVSGGEINVVAPPGYRTIMDSMDRSRMPFNGSANVIIQLQSLGASHPGLAGMATTVASTEVEWRVSLGSLRNGGSAGDLTLIDTGMRADWAPLFKPGALHYESTSAEVSVHRPSNIIRQVLANQVAVDVVTLSSTSYEIRCYHPTQVQGTSFPRTFTGQPYVTYRIEKGSNATSIKFTKEVRNVTDATASNVAVARRELMSLTRAGSWPAYSFTRSGWTLEGQTPISEATVVSSGTTAARSEEITVRATDNGPVALKVTRSYTVPLVNAVSATGEVLSAERVGTGTGLETSFDYYTDPANSGSLGYLKTATLPGGSWVAYRYYDTDLTAGYRGGRVKYRFKPFVNAPAIATLEPAQGEVTYYEYVNDVFGAPTRVSLAETKVNNTLVAKTTTAYNDIHSTANGFAIAQSITTEYSEVGKGLQTVVRYYRNDAGDDFVRAQTYSITKADGVKQSFAYQRGTWNGTLFTAGGGTIGTGTASRVSVITGNSASAAGAACPNVDGYVIDPVYLIDGKSTKEVTIRGSHALVVRTESHVWKNNGWQLVGWTNYTYDFGGRLTERKSSNGATYTAAYDGGLKVTETDEAGVVTNYTYTGAGQVDIATRTGIGTIASLPTQYIYDAAGRVLQEKVGSGSEKIVAARTYDDAGRLWTETPAGLGPVTHTYDAANRKHTVTQPGADGTPSAGATTITTTYLDGRPYSTTGTATVASYMTYGVESDGRRWQRADVGSTTSPRWTKAWSDWLGREVRSEAPGFTGLPNAVAESFYEMTAGSSKTGHLIKTKKSGYAPTLYEYNYLGQVSRSGLDVNSDGLLVLASTDRITETDSYLESFNGTWWMRTDTKTYPKVGVATAVVTSTSRSRLTGHPANRLSDTQSIDAEGNVTTQFVDVNRLARTSTATTTRSGVPTTQVETSVNGFSTSVTSFDGLTTSTLHDALLRPWQVTDSRINTTTNAYVPGTSRVSTVTNEHGDVAATHYDALGRTQWQRDPRNHYTRFAYNARGQVERQWGDGTMPVSYGYDPIYGERTTMSTYRGGTGFDGETWPVSPGDADTTTWTFDEPTGLLWKKTAAATPERPNGTTVVQTYNLRGQTATRTLARGVQTIYDYDDATGELLSQTYSDSTPTVTFTYGRDGQVETVTDFTGIRDFIYDPNKLWRLKAEAHDEFYGNRVLTRLYDESPIKGRVRGFQLGPVVGSGAELEQTFGFTTIGRFETLTTKRDANANSRTFRYAYRTDAPLIEALSIDGSHPFTVNRGYENERNLVTSLATKWSTDTRTSYAYEYDERGQRTSTVQSGDVFADYGDGTHRLYTYDGKGQVTGDAGYLGGTVTDQSKPLPGRKHTFGYDNAGNRKWSDRTGVDLDNDDLPDLRDTYTTNAQNQYTDRSNNTLPISGTASPESAPPGGAGGTAVAAVGRTVASGRQGAYWADELTVPNMLQAWRGPVTIFTAQRGTGGSADRYRVDTRMAEIGALLQEYAYDDDGNLTSDGIVDYQWDAENRLIRMETTVAAGSWGFPRKRIEFRYDYMGRRVSKQVLSWNDSSSAWDPVSQRRFLYDGWNLIAEYAVNTQNANLSLVRSYTWGLDIVSTLADAGGVGALLQIADHPTGKTYLPTYDGNGNIVSLLNGTSGALAAVYEYGPFGEALRAQTYDVTIADNPWRFSTKWTDLETSLIYYGHRYYDSKNGRFINKDPIAESGGLNLYGFCGNNGINAYDPLGLDPIVVINNKSYTVTPLPARSWNVGFEASVRAMGGFITNNPSKYGISISVIWNPVYGFSLVGDIGSYVYVVLPGGSSVVSQPPHSAPLSPPKMPEPIPISAANPIYERDPSFSSVVNKIMPDSAPGGWVQVMYDSKPVTEGFFRSADGKDFHATFLGLESTNRNRYTSYSVLSSSSSLMSILDFTPPDRDGFILLGHGTSRGPEIENGKYYNETMIAAMAEALDSAGQRFVWFTHCNIFEKNDMIVQYAIWAKKYNLTFIGADDWVDYMSYNNLTTRVGLVSSFQYESLNWIKIAPDGVKIEYNKYGDRVGVPEQVVIPDDNPNVIRLPVEPSPGTTDWIRTR